MPKAILLVVDDPAAWPLEMAGAELVAARAYLADARYVALRGAKVFNLCRSYRYQSLGYYVSLLAAARGHRPLPDVGALQDLKSQSTVRFVSAELDDLIQKSLRPLQSSDFVLSVYFGHNMARRYDTLSQHLFALVQAPFLRATFARNDRDGRWHLQNLSPRAGSEIPESHREFAVAMAQEYFAGARPRVTRRGQGRYDLAILVNDEEPEPPSNARALRRFLRAAARAGFNAELIGRNDYGRLAEFDALFLRETTNVNHHTYRFARRAAAEGLVTVDDPVSILRCTNKVFLAELLDRHHIAAPRTLIVHRGNQGEIEERLGLPCILKQPDGAFSAGVVRAQTSDELRDGVARLLQKSEMIIAQEFMPTPFDWRIGVFDRRPLYACKYYMAKAHWQILRRDSRGVKRAEGDAETLPVEEVPVKVLNAALKAASLFGDGLYGVDLKEVDGKVYVIEVNDNPNIDAGIEDAVLKEELYRTVMEGMMRRVEAKKERGRG